MKAVRARTFDWKSFCEEISCRTLSEMAAVGLRRSAVSPRYQEPIASQDAEFGWPGPKYASHIRPRSALYDGRLGSSSKRGTSRTVHCHRFVPVLSGATGARAVHTDLYSHPSGNSMEKVAWRT